MASMTAPYNPEDAREHDINDDGQTAHLPDVGEEIDHTDEAADTATDNPAADDAPTTER